MCIICVELQKGSLLPWEAARNLKEMSPTMDADHVEEVIDLISALQQESEYCEYCECDPCDCSWGTRQDDKDIP